MKKISIYLAGSCQFVEDEGSVWREEVENKLKVIGEWCNADIEVVNPLRYFSYKTKDNKSNHQIKNYYMSRILKCDLVLVNGYKTNHSPGTAQECQFAVDHNIPVIGFNKEDAYSWLIDVDCQVAFDTMTEALDYVRDYYIS